MICPKCGTENKENYCIKCGAIVTNGVVYQISRDEKPSIYDDLELYIGDNYHKIVHKNVNHAAGIFKSSYLMYRKCYTEGIIALIIEIISIFTFFHILNTYLYFIPPIFTMYTLLFLEGTHYLIYAVFTNSIYLHHCKKRIKFLKSQQNFEKSVLIEKGKPNAGPVVIFYCVIALIFVILIRFF